MAEQYQIILVAPFEATHYVSATLAVVAHDARKRWPGLKMYNPALQPRDRDPRWHMRQRGNALLDAPADALVVLHAPWRGMPSVDAQIAIARAIGLKVVEL
jgi:hypothetical protein